MKVKISNKELIEEIVGKKREFPKYVSQLINLANQNAQGTRPRIVGQLTELIKECPDKTYAGWKQWYLKRHPDTIKNAIEKISEMIKNFKDTIAKIDKEMIKSWAENLVLEQTFVGLRVEEAILKRLSKMYAAPYRLSFPSEESKGIDGFIGDIPVSIKPTSYKSKKSIREKLGGKMVYHHKTDAGLEFEFNARDFKQYADKA